jgi:autotransporter-associated beta strand protein
MGRESRFGFWIDASRRVANVRARAHAIPRRRGDWFVFFAVPLVHATGAAKSWREMMRRQTYRERRKRGTRRVSAAALAAAAVLAAPSAYATTPFWTNGDGTALWASANNWGFPHEVPSSGTGALFNMDFPGGAMTVTLPAGAACQFIEFGYGYTLTGGSLALGTGNGLGSNVTVDADTTATIDSGLVGSNGILKDGAGTLTLTGANSIGGASTISDGTLQVGDGGTTGSILTSITDNAALVFNRSDDVTFAGVISGAGQLTKSGGNTLTLTADNSFSGVTTISAGTLQLGKGGSTGFIGGSVTNNGTLVFNSIPARTFAGVISGGGSLSKLAGNMLTLSGNNSYSGGTTISSGIFQIGDGSTSGAITGNVNVASAATVIFNRSDDVTFGGVISGSGQILKLGAGTLVLSGDHTYSGFTSISAGTLQIGDGGTGGSISSTSVSDSGTLAFSRSDDVTYSGVINGTGGLSKLGDNTLTLISDNGYTGVTTIAAGTLELGGGDFGGLVGGNIVDNGTVVFNHGFTRTFSGAISGSGAVTKLGSNVLVLTGNNTYAGVTTISAGTLRVGNGSTSGSIAGDVTATGTLAFNRSDDITFGGDISGSGSFSKLAGNTLTLTGNNTYAGSTVVSSGILVLTKTYTSGSSLVVLDNTIARIAHSAATPNNVVLKTGSVNTNNSGTVDLTDNKLIVSGGDVGTFTGGHYTGITGKIQTGFNLGDTLWAGHGITTSLGGNGSSNFHALGVILNDLASVGQASNPIYTSFGGVGVGVNDVLVGYTYFGDADLDGAVTTNDYFQIDNGFLARKRGWINGDFDYDGAVTTNDYFLIDNAFLGQGAALVPSTLVDAAPLSGVSAVPEPASLGVLGFAGAGLLLRRRPRPIPRGRGR